MHYGFEYQRVPDNLRGDLGIEGFSRDGCAYQCYVAETGLTATQLYERQRDKITVDLGKLLRNALRLQAILGGLRIGRWVFLVPKFEGHELLRHGADKSAEIRGHGLNCITDDFQVVVSDDSRFAPEKAQLAHSAGYQLPLDLRPARDEDIAAWTAGQSQLLDNLERKLQTIWAEAGLRAAFRRVVVQRYLELQSLDLALSQEYSQIWLRLNRLRTAREATLAGDLLINTNAPVDLIRQLVENYAARVDGDFPHLSLQSRVIAWGVVATWLLECALDFQPRVA
jgi:hypothetical protein